MRADRRGRILLVDDHDAARRSLARVLGSVCDVVVAPSCEQALETLEDTKRLFDLVLLDPAFPEDQIHGAAALAQIRSRWPDLAIIVLSTLPELGAVARLMQAGATDYLTKDPETMGVLWLRVSHHVERVRLRRENRELRAQVSRLRAQADGAQAPSGDSIRPLPELLRRHVKHALSVRGTQKGAAAALQVDYYKFRRMLKELGLVAPKKRSSG